MSLELHPILDVDGAGRVRLGVAGDQLELEGTLAAAAAMGPAVTTYELEAPVPGQLELGDRRNDER